ncbi:MAG: hypothetical protein RI566_05135 [Sediminimonas sp.]|uniref:hypothetical protein n=1 Tax=Sediminimonas sp. TaxID=2823379 RepID=UPI00286FE301|nr:hypothetical protein [Sediminimonas sp.]MDR9484537.1 hypothetical protein [Sediminimonas sp.]
MSDPAHDPAHVTATEHGIVRVFHLSYAVSMEIGHMGTLDGLATALGVPDLDGRDVQIVALAEVQEMGLTEFLKLGYEISEDEIEPLRAELDGLQGKVAILRTGAFGGRDVHLATDKGAQLIAAVKEGRARPPTLAHADRPAEGAKGTLGAPESKRRPSDAAMSGRVATVALLVLFALVALMVWIGG